MQLLYYKDQKYMGHVARPTTMAWKGSPLIFQFLDFWALGKSFRHMHIPPKSYSLLKGQKGSKMTLESLFV